VGVLNINDIMFAHNIHAYIATRKGRVLKVTLQVATPGAESAVYDCLILIDLFLNLHLFGAVYLLLPTRTRGAGASRPWQDIRTLVAMSSSSIICYLLLGTNALRLGR